MVSKKLSIVLLLLSIGCSPAVHAGALQQFSINRISQDNINQRKALIIKQESKSTFARKVAKAGIFTLSVIGGVGIAYALFRSSPAKGVGATTGDNVQGVVKISKQQLQQQIQQLSERVEKGPKMWSLAWWKQCAVNLVLTPAALVEAIRGVGSLGGFISKKIFFADNPAGYVEQATRLGILTLQPNEQGILEKSLAKGEISKELERSAEMLDKMTPGADEGGEFHKKRVVANFNRIVADMTGLVAFICNMADKWSSVALLAAEATDRAQYLQHITNKASDALEASLNNTVNKQPVTTIVKEFFNELEQVLISFVRIEREYSSAMIKN